MNNLLPPKLVAMLVLAMILTTLVAPWPSLPWPVRALGIATLAAGLILNLRHAALFANIGTNIKTFDDPDVLVSSGAFAWTRNPMYVGFVAILLGLATALGSLVAVAGPIVFFIAADRWYIPFEERRMAATFGADYDRYRQEVRRWAGRKQARISGQTPDTRKVGGRR